MKIFLRFKNNTKQLNYSTGKELSKATFKFFYDNPEGSYESLKKTKILQKLQNEKMDGPKRGCKKSFFLTLNSDSYNTL